MMFSAFQTFGKLGAIGKAIASAWSPLSLWPDGIDTPGMWISPRALTSQWADYTGTTPVATPGTVADSSNPVGLALDIRAGATALADPGNHMLQATSTARPLLSARRNLLTYTEDFSSSAWGNPTWGSGTSAYTRNYAAAPDGTTTATRLVATAPTTSPASGGSTGHTIISGLITRSVWLKSNTGSSQLISLHINAQPSSLRTVTTEWARYEITFSDISYGLNIGVYRSGNPASDTDASCDILMWHPQIESGTTATDYQSIPGDGSTYASTGFPVAQLYDGVDDGMATAAFSAGTLIDGMDCLIAVRRDSAGGMLLGISGEPSATEKYTGACINDAGDITYKNCGTPTVWIDGVQLAGGTTTTRAALFAALTVGDWHILEYRNLDLSSWVALHYGNVFTGLNFNGPRGDIMLYPSTTPTEDKDAARQWLADYYGVTLP